MNIQRGFKALLKVKPLQVVSDEDIRGLTISDRNCRFDDELPEDMVLFQKYSPTGCRFECMFQFR